MINEELLKGKWNETKGEIRTQWGKNMPFDGSRMILGGFDTILDQH